MAQKPTLGYWNIRGFAEHLRLLLRYLDVDFEDKQYEYVGTPPNFEGNEWYKVKYEIGLDFPNIPYWIDEEVKLSQSKPILKYLAKKYGKGKALVVPEGDAKEAVVDMVIGALTDMQALLVRFAYGRLTKHDVPIEHAQVKPLQDLARYLGGKKWIFGDEISYVDFFMYEVLKQYIKFRTTFLKAQPTLEKFVRRFEEIPKLQDYLKSTENVRCYSPFAIPF